VTAETAAQLGDRRNAVAAVEMIVDQQPVRFEAACVHGGQRRSQVHRGEDLAAPAAEQFLHAVQNGAVVVDAQHDRAGEPGEPPGSDARQRM